MLNHNRVKRTDCTQTLAVTHLSAITVPCTAFAALIFLVRQRHIPGSLHRLVHLGILRLLLGEFLLHRRLVLFKTLLGFFQLLLVRPLPTLALLQLLPLCGVMLQLLLSACKQRAAVLAGRYVLDNLLHHVLYAVTLDILVLDTKRSTRIRNLAHRLERQRPLAPAVHVTAHLRSDYELHAVNVHSQFAGLLLGSLAHGISHPAHLRILLLEEILHLPKTAESHAIYGDSFHLPVGEMLLNRSQVGRLPLYAPLRSLDITLDLRQPVVDIYLVHVVPFALRHELTHLPFRLILQNGILAARKLRRHVAERILILLHDTVFHRILHQLRTVHYRIRYRSLRLQTLVSRHVQAVLHAEADNTHRDTHILVEIPLSQSTSVTLSVVHRPVGRIHMYQRMKTLLYVHARTQSKGRTHDDAYFAGIHLVEYVKLLLDSHPRLHNHNLLLGYACLHKFLLYILIEVETAPLVLVHIGENSNRALVRLAVFQRTQRLAHSRVSLAVRVVLRIVNHQANVYGRRLRYPVHRQRYMAVLLLLLARHVLETVKLRLHELHYPAQSPSLRQVNIRRLAALHLRYLVAHPAGVARKNRIGHAAPYTHKFRQVHISRKSIVLLELAARRKLDHLRYIAEVANEIVKIIDSILLHTFRRHQITHERPYLRSRVRYGSTRGKHHIAPVVALHHRLRFQIHSLRLLAERRVNTLNAALHSRRKSQVLVFVSLVHKDSVYTHIVEVLDIVNITVKHLQSPHLRVLSRRRLPLLVALPLLLLYRLRKLRKPLLLPLEFLLRLAHHHAAALAVRIAHRVENPHLLLYNILYVGHLALLAVRYLLENRLRDHYHIPVVVLDFRVEVLAPLRRAVRFLYRQHLRIRIYLLGALHKLPHRRVLNNYHRLARSSETPHLHSRGYQREGLSRADLMCKKNRLGSPSHYRTPLVWPQRERLAVKGAHLPSEMLRHKLVRYRHRNVIVEPLVVRLFHPRRHLRVLLHLRARPVLELRTYLVYPRSALHRRSLVRYRFIPIRVLDGFAYRYLPVGQSRLYQLVTHDGLVAHLALHRHRTVLFVEGIIRLLHDPRPARVSQLHPQTRLLEYIILVKSRLYPRRTQRKLYQVCRYRHRHDALQSLDIGIITPVLVVLPRYTQLLADIARKVFIRHLHRAARRILKTQTARDDFTLHPLGRHPQRLADVVQIYTAMLVQTRKNSILYRLRLRFLFSVYHAAAEYVGLPGRHNLIAVLITFLGISLQCLDTREIHIILQERYGSILVQIAVGAGETVERTVQFLQQRSQSLVSLVGRLILKHIRKRLLYRRVSLEALRFRMPLNLVLVHFQRNSLPHARHANLPARVQQHTSLFHTFSQTLIYPGHGIFGSRNAGARSFPHGSKTICPFRKHRALLLPLHREQTPARRKSRFTSLEVEKHLAGHILRMLREILVQYHPQLLDHRNLSALHSAGIAGIIIRRPHTRNIGDIYRIRRLAAPRALAYHDNIRSRSRPAERLVMHSERSYHIRVPLAANPYTQVLRVIHRAARRNEDSYTSLAQLADILRYTEISDIVELLRQILVARVVEHRKPRHKRNISDSKVNAAVRYPRLLETLYIHLRVRVKQRQYPASRRIHLHGVDSAAVAHIRRHQPQDIADTRRAFEHIAPIEAQRPRNIPHRIYHRSRCVICRTPALHSRLISIFAQQLAQPFSRRVAVGTLVESLAQAAPAAELAEHSHLLRSSSLPALKQTTRQLYRLYVRLYAGILSLRCIIGAALGTVVTHVPALSLRNTLRYRVARR